MTDLTDSLRELAAARGQARADAIAAGELLRRAEAVAKMWRAKRIAAYSLADIEALNALDLIVAALTGETP